jgi:tetratricopeptide (TPR) repeat protein
MTSHIKHINSKTKAIHRKGKRGGFDADQPLNREDAALFKTIGEYMKGKLDLEEVRNDPSLRDIETVVKDMVSDYNADRSKHSENENFIRDNFAGTNRERKLLDEISNIKFEIHKSDINEISAEWVKEWHEKKKKDASKDSKTEEIRDFIESSLDYEKSEPEVILKDKETRGIKRTLLIRYLSLSAAAVIGVFILIRTLLPSSDPGTLYNSYYKPFNVISSVTRGAPANDPYGYSAALESYRLGDYQVAAAGFSKVMLTDTSAIAPRFFMGITQLAVKNYDQAIKLLGGINNRPGDYHKETMWYLGLAYLKTGEKAKAAECFEPLAQLSGFYSERSKEILRRLK